MVSLVAQQVAGREQWDVSRGIRELANHLTAEAEKPGKDFGELVRSRRKERGLPVKQRETVLPEFPLDWQPGKDPHEFSPIVQTDLGVLSPPWDEECPASRPELRLLAAEQRVREAFHQLEAAELRQEPAGKMAWYEAQYAQELATYDRVCSQRTVGMDNHMLDPE